MNKRKMIYIAVIFLVVIAGLIFANPKDLTGSLFKIKSLSQVQEVNFDSTAISKKVSPVFSKDFDAESMNEAIQMQRNNPLNASSYQLPPSILEKISKLKKNPIITLPKTEGPGPKGCTNYKRQSTGYDETYLLPGDILIGPNNIGILYDIVDNKPSIVEVAVNTASCKVYKIKLLYAIGVSTSQNRNIIALGQKGWGFAAELQGDGRLKVSSIALNTYQACQSFLGLFPAQSLGLLNCDEVEPNITKRSYNRFDIYIPQGLPNTYGGPPFANNSGLLADVVNAESEQCYNRLAQFYGKQLPVIDAGGKIAIIFNTVPGNTGNNIVDRIGYSAHVDLINVGLDDTVAVQNFLAQPRCLGTQVYAELNDMFGITDMPFWMMEGFAVYDDQTVLWGNPLTKNDYLSRCAADGYHSDDGVQAYFNQSSPSQLPNSIDPGRSTICFWIDVERLIGRAGITAILQTAKNLHEIYFGSMANTNALLNPVGGQAAQTLMTRYGWPVMFRIGNGLPF